MHILLTDLLTCPRCGPEFGLIVLSEELAERQVRQGWLGCANCRTSYPIHRGTADLRTDSCAPLQVTTPLAPDPERPVRVAALLGLNRPGATVLIVEPDGVAAENMSGVVPEVHLVSGMAGDPGDPDGRSGGFLSRVLIGSCLPFRGGLGGVAVLGIDPIPLLPEVARVLSQGGRLVVEGAPEGLAADLARSGFTVHLEQDGVVVAGTSDRS